jgi:hypothetical protein
MSDLPNPAQAPSSPQPGPISAPRRGLLSFLFRTPLGLCVSLLGFLAVLTLFAPTLAGSLAPGRASAWFDERYQGRLKVESANLAWFAEQSLEGVELLDPSGAPVAKVQVRLQSLWSLVTGGGTRIGKVLVVAEASLAADASGRTNLDAALAPRGRAGDDPAGQRPEDRDGGASESGSAARDLELDLDLRVSRLVWSDERTRAQGQPFEIQDLTLTCTVKPGEPLVAKLAGRLSGSAGGSLGLDARIEHPFDAPSSSTPPAAEVSGRIERFPVPLLDALARQGGKLQGLLGEEVSLDLTARGTLEQGSFDLRVDAPLAQVRAEAKFDAGVLRTVGEGLRAELELSQAFVDATLAGRLPAGASLTRIADPAAPRVVLGLPAFELPLGAYLEANARGEGQAALRALLAGTRAQLAARLGSWDFADPARLSGTPSIGVRALTIDGDLSAVDLESSLRVRGGVSTPGGPAGASELDLGLSWRGGATVASFAPAGALEPVRWTLRIDQWPTALVDALAQGQGDVTRALGDRVDGSLTGEASLEAADNSDLQWATIGTRWRELARRVHATCELKLRGTSKGEGLAALGGAKFSLDSLGATLALAPGKPVDLRAHAQYATVSAGRFELAASVAECFADDARKTPPRFDVKASATGLPVGVAGALSGQGAKLEQLLGSSLNFAVQAGGTLDAGTVNIGLTGERTHVLLAARLENGVLSPNGGSLLRATLAPEGRLLHELLDDKLPAGTRLVFTRGRGALDVSVASVSVPLGELLELGRSKPEALVATLLAKSSCAATASLGQFEYLDDKLVAAGTRIGELTLQLGMQLSPQDGRAPLRVTLQATSPAFGTAPLLLELDAPHAPSLLSAAQGADFEPLVVRATCENFSTALLDAYAGGALQGALGPQLSLELQAGLAQPSDGHFRLDATLGLSGASGASKVTLGARALDPLNLRAAPDKRRTPGVPPELDVNIEVTGAGALMAFAPEDSRELARQLIGDKIAGRIQVSASAADAAAAEVVLNAGSISLDGAADFRGGLVSSSPQRPILLRVAPSREALARSLAGKLPEGASLVLAEPGGVFQVELAGLSIPVARFLAAEPAVAAAELVANTAARLEATLPTLVYTHPPAAPAAGRAPSPATSVTLRGVRLQAQLALGQPAKVDVTGAVDAEPPGAVEAHVVVEGPGGFLVEPLPAGSRARLSARLSRFPSALVDALAAQDGLIVDVLGPELEAVVQGVWPDSAGEPIRAELRSQLGDVALTSSLADGVIQSQGDQGLDAKVGLTPLFSKRIVGSLVPLFVQLRQDDPTQRTLLTGRNLALPMDADLSKLSGDLVLDLGAVEYELLPGLKQVLALTGTESPAARSTVVKPIAIRILNGVARYDAIPVKISGRDVIFRGQADLAQKSFELAFNLPLELLGSKVESKLEEVREYLDPKTEVPLELYGSWTSPRVRLGKGFLEKALKQAGAGALERGLGELLGGGKKKKKKQDG